MLKSQLVSVIVLSRNSENFIGSCLESLINQSYKNFEIIVVDNNSNDRTKLIAACYTDKIYNFGPERIQQINFGVECSQGKYIFWRGTNSIVEKNYIEKAVKKCEEEDCDAIYLNVITQVNNPNIWQKARLVERECYYLQTGMSSAKFCKKDVFLKLGGLDEKLGAIADDLEFQHRLNLNGYKTCFIEANVLYQGEYNSARIIMKRSLYYGWLMIRYYQKHPKKFRSQYKLIRNEFKRNILMKDKKVFIFFILYKTIQYFFGITGVVLAKISGNNLRVEKFLYKINFNSTVS